MEYVIYSAESGEGTIINMTHNPELDLGYLKDAYGISGIKVLTPYMPAAYGHYVLSNMARDYNPFRRILPRAKELNERLRYESLKRLLKDIGETPLKKPEVVVEAGIIPSIEDMLKVYKEYKCRIVEAGNVYKNTSIFLESDIYDIVQALYLDGKLKLIPPVVVEKPGKRYVCSRCGEDIINHDMTYDIVCEGCSTSIADGPFLAFSDDRLDKRPGRVKYKEYRKLDFYQAAAASELAEFIDGSSSECLLWSVPGSLNCCMLMESIRKVLDAGGRVGIGVPGHDDENMFLDALKDAFPGLSCLDKPMGSSIQDLVVCDYEHMTDYYRAFDLLVIYENAGFIKRYWDNWYKHIKRAAADGGKVVYFTSSPGYDIFTEAQCGNISIAAVPLKSHGKPSPEPRILTCRGLSPDNLFLPEVLFGIINWSLENSIRVRILVPCHEHINLLQSALIDSGIVGYNFNEINSPILLSTWDSRRKFSGDAESIIVFFADDDIFDERMLVDAAGLSEKCPENGVGEVVFVGARESRDMYNAKMMVRELNKRAWEMGYLKQHGDVIGNSK